MLSVPASFKVPTASPESEEYRTPLCSVSAAACESVVLSTATGEGGEGSEGFIPMPASASDLTATGCEGNTFWPKLTGKKLENDVHISVFVGVGILPLPAFSSSRTLPRIMLLTTSTVCYWIPQCLLFPGGGGGRPHRGRFE